jgi:hypothetical protein
MKLAKFGRKAQLPVLAGAVAVAETQHSTGGADMANSSLTPADRETPPRMQRIFDNAFLLLALGVLIMLVVYTGWGMLEVLSMPKGNLP